MATGRYVLYVGTYTHGSSKGIYIYDMDLESGELTERKVIPVNNPAHLTISHKGTHLYTIADEGVEAYEILDDGDLKFVNRASIKGMRGRYISTDATDRLLYVGGFHDGKVTVLSIQEDGSIGEICDGIFHKSTGSVADRNFRPHVSCVIPTPDNAFMCAVDIGLDQVKIYKVDKKNGKLRLVDILRCELESGPRLMLFGKDGRFAYVINEIKNYISVYSYQYKGLVPQFEEVQRVSTMSKQYDTLACAASGMKLSADGNYLYCSNSGQNSIGIFAIDPERGTLTERCILPISGDYPKDLEIFPDDQHIIALNHESGTITMFRVDYQQNVIMMNHKPVEIDTPNCGVVYQTRK